MFRAKFIQFINRLWTFQLRTERCYSALCSGRRSCEQQRQVPAVHPSLVQALQKTVEIHWCSAIQFALGNLNIISISRIWHSLHALVRVLLEACHIFYEKVGIHAQVHAGNLDTIPTSIMAVFMAAWRLMGFSQGFDHFSRSSRSPGVERHSPKNPHRGPLPMKQRFANIHLSTSQLLSGKTTTIIHSGEAPFQQAETLHSSLRS